MTDSLQPFRSLHSITRGALVFVVGLVVMNVIGFGVKLLLTHSVGVEGYGIYAYTITITGMILMMTNLGTDTSLLKYIPEYEGHPATQRAILGLAFLTSVLGGVIAAVSLFVAAPLVNFYTLNDPTFVAVLRLFAIVVALNTIRRIINRTFRSLELIEYEVVLSRIVRPTLNLMSVVLAVVFGLSFYGFMVALVLASVLTFWASIYLLITRISLRPRLRGLQESKEAVTGYYNFSVPLTFSGGSRFVENRVDILLVGLILSSSAVGIYNISLLFASALLIPLIAVNQLFPPVASRLHAEGRTNDLRAVYGTITRWTFTVALIVGLVVITYRRELLGIFGEEFVAGSGVLVFILAGQLVNSATGPSNSLLIMTGHQYVALGNRILFGLFNLGVSAVFILRFGLIGAGVATFLVLGGYNLAKLGEIWYLEGIHPYSLRFVKPIIAASGAAFVMVALGNTIDGVVLIVGGTIAGVSTFVVLLYLIGIEADDIDFFTEFVADQRSTVSRHLEDD